MFIPKRIIFEKDVFQYSIANEIRKMFETRNDIEIIYLSSNRYKQHIPGEDLYTQFREGKRTLVVDTKKSLKFQSCKPSAHYQLPLVTGCMGQCEYCYLNTNLGDKPFVRVHVNLEDILNQTQKYISEKIPEITIFEGAATSDPVPVEPYTNLLKRTIEFFGEQEYGRFRFVTKYNDVDNLLNIPHNEHTEVRFSINTPNIIQQYEKGTASFEKRIEASIKMMEAGYPIGYLIAPVFIYQNWKDEYRQLLHLMSEKLSTSVKFPITFEIISHRYTSIAKSRILEVFPESTLPMENEERMYKYGQFGYGKYVYKKEDISEIKSFFTEEIEKMQIHSEIKYII
ncbi:spore photoproduct lyase [Anaerosacchariphilus polymeriproducens]|uniref:Spore photoproduct lyase n=1 Tax=Anaerosacchariphilus polymeriproducens TaxID=1812858 RepID=A0A371ASI0_9FIRM|nr:spore photoproduct lyase [Anaerosacchariphilus polymeriproducens]RDU22525.1 spore photoproduct lyase [Anaerosacchariphilus polymeriproducens]